MVERFDSVKSIEQLLNEYREWKKNSGSVLTTKQREISEKLENLLERSRPWQGKSPGELNELLKGKESEWKAWHEDLKEAMLKAIKCNLELLHNPFVDEWISSRELFGSWAEDIVKQIKQGKEK